MAEKYGKGIVDRRNLAEMYHKAVKKLNVRGIVTCRKRVANMSLADPPVPLQGKRPVMNNSTPPILFSMGKRRLPESEACLGALCAVLVANDDVLEDTVIVP